MVEAAIGQHLRIGGRAAEKSVFLDQRHARAALRRPDGRADAAGTAARDDHVVGVHVARHQFLQLRKAFSARVMSQLTIRPRIDRIATPAMSWSVDIRLPARST